MNGEIDMVITKSISRFARNTLDTLNYVRMLKEKNVAVFFEEENINTLTMDGELLLTILSSVAQQEVENISANVKKGLKMKMQRGELVGFQGCLGYDYDKATKAISINEEEAKIVKYIFKRYNEGIGCYVIAQELEHLGYKTKRGSSNWAESTVMGILKNEKYKGDIRQGKTFTVDPISKRRLDNLGEEDQFYIHNHHEGIISNELFESVQKIINRRRKSRNTFDGKRETFTRKYSFSCMLECGFCGSHLTRRSWHSGTEYYKVIWQCVTNTKKGKKYCPDAKGIPESIIEEAFLESYKLLCYNNTDVVDEMLNRIEISLCSNNPEKEISNIERLISKNAAKKQKLLDMRLDDTLDKDSFDIKFNELNEQLDELNDRLTSCKNTENREKNIKKRLDDFRKVLEKNEVLVEFDRQVFESIIDKVIVGGYDDDGNKDPSMLTFVYKTGFTNSVDANNHKLPRKKRKKNKEKNENKLSSYSPNEDEKMCSLNSDNTDGDGVSEIISGHSDGTVSVLSSDGYFKWGWPQKVVSAPVRSLKIADLDSDGRSEIIAGFGTESPENVWVFEPDGSVRPGWPQMDAGHRAQDGGDYRENGWAWGVFNDNISTGDIDGDGQLEIIVPSDLAFTAAYNPDGTQVKANETYYGGRTWAKIPFYEDYGTEIRMDNEGWGFPLDGTEKREDLFRAEMGHAGSCVYDLDGDGKNEVALVGIMANRKYSFYPPTEYMTLFILNGDRTRFYNAEKGYDWRRIPTDLGAPLVQTPEIISSRVNSKPVVEDLNGDGVPEILFPSYNGKLHCFSLDRSEKGAWPYSLTKRTSPLFEYASAPACADINGDGKKEVVFVSFYDPSQSVPQGSGGSLYILDCEGRLISKTQLPPSKEAGNYINGSMATPLIYDTDGDGVLEIVINTLHGGISVFGL